MGFLQLIKSVLFKRQESVEEPEQTDEEISQIRMYNRFVEHYNQLFRRDIGIPKSVLNRASDPKVSFLGEESLPDRKPKYGRLSLKDRVLTEIDELLKDNEECFICEPGFPNELKIDKERKLFMRIRGRKITQEKYTLKEKSKEFFSRYFMVVRLEYRKYATHGTEELPDIHSRFVIEPKKIRKEGWETYNLILRANNVHIPDTPPTDSKH